MKFIITFIITVFASLPCLAEGDLDSRFNDKLDQIKAQYREEKATLIKKADRVVVYLIDFDGGADEQEFKEIGDYISIASCDKLTRALLSKELGTSDRKTLLNTLSKTISKPEHSGGAFCHFPVHGIRVYSGDKLLHEGTFCWICGNFSFRYPEGAEWLDTNTELKEIFAKLIPIPKSELDRFYEKYPSTKPKAE